MTQYSCKYIKAIPLKVEKIESKVQLENLIPTIIEKSFDREDLCQMCSKKQIMDVKIKIAKYPKILILIFINYQNEVKIKFEKYLKIILGKKTKERIIKLRQ